MNIVIRVGDSDRVRAWGLLVRHSPGTALPNNTFIVSDSAARKLRNVGIDFEEITRDREPVVATGAAASERI